MERSHEPHVVNLDALLQFGNGAPGIDFEALSFSPGQVVSDLVVIGKEKLTPAQFSDLADVRPR